MGFPLVSVVKESAGNAGDVSWIPGWGRSPGEGNGNPLQYTCQENPMDRGGWQATVHMGRKVLDTAEWVSTHACNKKDCYYLWNKNLETRWLQGTLIKLAALCFHQGPRFFLSLHSAVLRSWLCHQTSSSHPHQRLCPPVDLYITSKIMFRGRRKGSSLLPVAFEDQRKTFLGMLSPSHPHT